MPLVAYSHAEHFDLLREASETRRGFGLLGHEPFIRWYYTSSDRCRLWLFLGGAGELQGLIGIERLRLDFGGERTLSIGFGHQFHAFEQGIGGVLFLHWLRSEKVAITYGGSADTHRIVDAQRWVRVPGVRELFVNPSPSAPPRSPGVRRAARALRNWAVRRDLRRFSNGLPTRMRDRFTIRRITEYATDMGARPSAFHVRLRYDADHLAWRYAQDLSFIRYHAFEILDREEPGWSRLD